MRCCNATLCESAELSVASSIVLPPLNIASFTKSLAFVISLFRKSDVGHWTSLKVDIPQAEIRPSVNKMYFRVKQRDAKLGA